MTKSDLETILLKIRNRCGLEEQTKITYYWDEEKSECRKTKTQTF